jgi:hypothetical protein
MAGVTSIIGKESLEEIAQRLSQTSKPIIKNYQLSTIQYNHHQTIVRK